MISDLELNRIIRQLQNFACTEKEAQIYLKVLKIGPATVQEIAKALKNNRVTVYSATEQLKQKGLLYETKKGKKRLIAAEKPDVLYKIMQKKENDLNLMKINLDHLVGLLNKVDQIDRYIPVIKLYEDVNGFKKMLEETLEAKNEVLVFSYVDVFAKLINPDYLENYFQRRAKKGISTRLIFPPCDFAYRVNQQAKKYKIQIRLLPEMYKWKSGIFAWNNYLAILAFTEGKLSCTIIGNQDIAHFYRHIIFELIWSIAKEI
ncbi:hypothetical protein A2272_01940 [Candidatus Peregrinibacteria bacterium RIFOXYA12_FULL_33_12]|nr:MAG: hypothetical protein A2263_02630 [Candidatus Peregrinibacteria bacterium RIFOXYA2_FULL_33_21]OGJ44887.1 MAG: hypothetical protein A2272_01940 [Candidatus Peregrinibacteria bacterium RIFOXYA12_FULL_33_12]OGJ50032.1 MAG: hypothetical protein A2307_01350 [Candidatus Peregrinibacteria bacterium RIFOXYB2_FULL_33_20]